MKINFLKLAMVVFILCCSIKQEGYVHTTTRKSDNGGPKRKYYTISESGQEELERFKEKWSYLNSGMNNLFGSDEYDD